MRILMNVNEQISATMMENHFQASNMQAMVTATPKDMMLEILRVCKIDIAAYYTEQVDNEALLSFFNEIRATSENVRCLLFVKKENLSKVSEELESCLDECFTIPLDSKDLMIRLRRLMRSIELRNPPPVTVIEQPVQQGIVLPEIPQPPVVQYTPPPIHEIIKLEQPSVIISEMPQPKSNTTLTEISDTVGTKDIYSYASQSRPQNNPEQTPENAQSAAVSSQPNNTGFQVKPFTPQEYFNSKAEITNTKKDKKQQKNIFVKVLGGISKLAFGFLIFLIAIMAVFMVKSKLSGGTPSVLGYQLYGVLSGSMNGSAKTSFDTGSLVFVKEKDVGKIVVGDIITFRGLSADSPLTTHRVVKVNNGEKLSFTTRGDANNVDDPNPIAAERVVGTVRGHLPYVGYLTGIAQTKKGLIFMIFIPGSLVIIYETINIFKVLKNERKKNKDD